MTERCETCRWWDNRGFVAGYGVCGRYPPAHSYPITYPDHRCGEWSKRDGDGND